MSTVKNLLVLGNTRVLGTLHAGEVAACSLPYGVCSSAASEANKVLTLSDFILKEGSRISFKFEYTNTASDTTLNVNSSGAKAMMFGGVAIPSNYLNAGFVYEFCYDGTNWELVSGMGAVEAILDSLISQYTAA